MANPPQEQLKTNIAPRPKSALSAVEQLLLGTAPQFAIPELTELTAAVVSLANGTRSKALLPLASAPIEYALVRRDDHALVTCYGTDASPDVHLRDRKVSLRLMLDACARAIIESIAGEHDTTARQIATRVAERAMSTRVAEAADNTRGALNLQGGALDSPGKHVPLAFGYEMAVHPESAPVSSRSSRADVHALLFKGSLWAYSHGQRIILADGPIMLAAQRMVMAVRRVVDAWTEGRPTKIKLRTCHFSAAFTLNAGDVVDIELGTDGKQSLRATGLSVQEATLPVLKVAGDLLRTLTTADRNQSRNLRVRELRKELRCLRREIRSHRARESFVNLDPDRFRVEAQRQVGERQSLTDPVPSLRFEEAWRIAIDGIDASSTFLCGNRIIAATPSHLVAIGRDDGDVLWARPGQAAATLMASQVLIRVSLDGDVELCSVTDGEPYATTRIAPRIGSAVNGLMAGGGKVPPIAVLPEGSHRLVAIDAQTGEARWRFASRSGGDFRLARAGRVLLVTCGEESLHAVDVATGEDIWRFSDRGAFRNKPAICGETAVAAASQGALCGEVFGLDLYSGELRWRNELPGAPTAFPQCTGDAVIVSTVQRDERLISSYNMQTGKAQWRECDPGVGLGGACLAIDDLLITNAPMGRLSGVDITSGELRWHMSLSDPLADEIPRRLEPILRGGALFVPASSVHVVRPIDGTALSANLPCDLVPDLIRVDERGWIYVAEESGCMAAYRPTAHLRLVHGGIVRDSKA